jgi:hypothetical protein
MRELLAPWTVRAVTSYPQVLDSAREAGLLSGADVRELLRFYADPRLHRWHSGPAADASLSGAVRMQQVFQYLIPRAAWQHLLQFCNTYYDALQHLLQPAGQNDRLKWLLTVPSAPF